MAFSEVIARLAVSLNLDTTAFTTGSRKAQAEAGTLQGKMAKTGLAIAGAFAAMQVGSKLADLVSHAVEYAAALSEDAEKLGLTVEALQELRLAAVQNGVSNEQLATTLTRLNKSLGDLQLGKKAAVDAFASIGISAAELKGKAPEQSLAIIADSLNKLPDPQQRVAVGAQLMGRSFAQLLPLLDQGSKGLADYAQKSREQGEVSTQDAKNLDELHDRWDAFKTALLTATANIVAGLIPYVEKIGAALDATRAFFAGVHDSIASGGKAFVGFLDSVRSTMAGVHDSIVNTVKAIAEWIGNKLNAIWDSAGKRVAQVEGYFRDLYEAVVGHSYVPDMVDEIGAQMKRLDALMVDPAQKAAQKTTDTMRDMATDVRGLLDRLFPEVAAFNQYMTDRANLIATLGESGSTAARLRLADQYDQSKPASSIVPSGEMDSAPIADIGAKVTSLTDALGGLAKKSQITTVQVAKSFKDMADQTLSSLNSLAQAIKGGGFLNILQSVINLGLQLGSIGAFGKGIQTRISSVPGHAAGTPSAGRGLAWVGERGPELVNFRGGERVFNNRDSMAMGGGVMEIRPSPLFEVYVDSKLVGAAPAIASAGGDVGVQRMTYAQTRRVA